MSEIYLDRHDLKNILDFLNDFPDQEVVQVTADSSSGIGTVIKATIIGATVNGNIVTVTKHIVDEAGW